ncbi:lipase family protein [Muricoccus radiodurans]|uniref:lipase family protein n=1 Tax=Muricoccus radiodurans TaxID=2231721 RepID=UPI003CECDB39
MTTCFNYAKIAYAAYFTSTNQYYADPPGHMVDDWTVQKWETGTLFGNGFQGGIWQNSTDVVVGCCGTNPKQKGKFLADLGADLKIGLRILPNQATGARKMLKAAKAMAQGRRVSITGHSLGGGLAQVAGLWEEVPFVTFNAPAMAHVIKAAHINIFKPQMMVRTIKSKAGSDTPGLNFRITEDKVSMHGIAGGHVGLVITLNNRYKDAVTGDMTLGAHGKNTIMQAVLESTWSDVDPFFV